MRPALDDRSLLVLILVTLLPFAACFPEVVPPAKKQEISGATTIGETWTTLTPPEPLRVAESIQYVHLDMDRILSIDPSSSTITLAGGQEVGIEGELIDDQGEAYKLTVGGMGRGLHLYRTATILPLEQPELRSETSFPKERRYVELRLRATSEIQIENVTWVCMSNT